MLEFKEGAGLPRSLAGEQLNTVPVADRFKSPECEESKTPILVVVARSYDPAVESLKLDLSICTPSSFLEPLIGAKTEPVYGHGRCANLPKGFASARLILHFAGEAEAITGESTHSVPMPRNNCDSLLTSMGSATVDLAGDPARYPFDRYVVNSLLSVVTEDGIHEPGANSEWPAGGFPLEVRSYVGSGVAPLAIRARLLTNDAPLYFLSYELRRKSLARVYVGLVLTIPLLLELLLFRVLFRRHGSGDRPIGPEVLAGVAAVLLAMLPIRQVLVPASVSVLTRVDYVLAFEMALLVAGACVAVALQVRSPAAPDDVS